MAKKSDDRSRSQPRTIKGMRRGKHGFIDTNCVLVLTYTAKRGWVEGDTEVSDNPSPNRVRIVRKMSGRFHVYSDRHLKPWDAIFVYTKESLEGQYLATIHYSDTQSRTSLFERLFAWGHSFFRQPQTS